jgi:adenylosuccinate synthase
MVIDPEAFFAELETISEQGISYEGRVFVSPRAHIVLPRYKTEDREREQKRTFPIGTTGRGIGVAFAHKAFRDGIRVADLWCDSIMKALASEDREFLESYRERLAPFVIDPVELLERAGNGNILFEGAQGTLLDLDLGTYPFVSSGYSAAAGACFGSGIGPRAIDGILGVFKAYSTRVGNGPFPTEFREEREPGLSAVIRDLGREYGVTTGRPRRCGYLDLVALRYACRTNSIDSLVLTHLDVYDSFDEIKVCTEYRCGNRRLSRFPASLTDLETAEPVLRGFKGWKRSIGSAKSWEELPDEARGYVSFIEEFTGTPIGIISVGYERSATIIRRKPWTRY